MALGLSFAFDPQKGETPETVARRRALAEMILGRSLAPKNVGEGWHAIANGVVAAVQNHRANKAEAAGQASAAAAFNPLLDAFRTRLSGGFPAAPSSSNVPNPGNSTAMASMPAPDIASARVAQAHGDSTLPAGNLSEHQQAFVQTLLPAAIEESKRTGVDPRIIVAQAAQETGWGKSAPGNNFFGIKSHGKGGGQALKTHEYINGKRVNVTDSFRTFASPEDSVRGYGDFILQNKRYKPLREAQGLDAQLAALQASGYATDPNYSRSVGAIARSIPLPEQAPAPQVASGLTPDALQAWGANAYAPPMPANSAVDAVNALGTAQPVPVVETEEDILAQEAAMAAQDPQAFQPGPMMAQPSPGTQPRLPQPVPVPSFQPEPQVAQPAPPLPDPRMVQDMPVAGVPQQPVQVAQAGGFPEMAGNNPQALPAPAMDIGMLLQAAQNPWLNEQQRGIVNMLLQQELQAQDPMRQLDMEKKRLEVEQMRNPTPKDTDDIREYQFAVSQGYQGTFQDFMLETKRAGAPTINNNIGPNSSKFTEESDRLAATRMNEYVGEGARASMLMSDMEQLLDLGSIIGTGREAELKAALGPYAQALGVQIDNLGEAEAYKSITERLAPQLRPAGAGSSSDRDVAMYLNAIPQLRNTPEGNTLIANTMRGIAQNKMQAAEIAARAQMGEITWQEAEKQIRALPNPYENFKQFMKETGPRGRSSTGIQWSIED